MEEKIKFSGRSAEVLYMAELLESTPVTNRFASYIRELYAKIPSGCMIDTILEYDILCALKEVFKAIGKDAPDEFPSYVSIDHDENSYKELVKDLIFSIENIAALYKIPEKSFLKILRDWLVDHSEFIYYRKGLS
jgi:hypothetical protein